MARRQLPSHHVMQPAPGLRAHHVLASHAAGGIARHHELRPGVEAVAYRMHGAVEQQRDPAGATIGMQAIAGPAIAPDVAIAVAVGFGRAVTLVAVDTDCARPDLAATVVVAHQAPGLVHHLLARHELHLPDVAHPMVAVVEVGHGPAVEPVAVRHVFLQALAVRVARPQRDHRRNDAAVETRTARAGVPVVGRERARLVVPAFQPRRAECRAAAAVELVVGEVGVLVAWPVGRHRQRPARSAVDIGQAVHRVPTIAARDHGLAGNCAVMALGNRRAQPVGGHAGVVLVFFPGTARPRVLPRQHHEHRKFRPQWLGLRLPLVQRRVVDGQAVVHLKGVQNLASRVLHDHLEGLGKGGVQLGVEAVAGRVAVPAASMRKRAQHLVQRALAGLGIALVGGQHGEADFDVAQHRGLRGLVHRDRAVFSCHLGVFVDEVFSAGVELDGAGEQGLVRVGPVPDFEAVRGVGGEGGGWDLRSFIVLRWSGQGWA